MTIWAFRSSTVSILDLLLGRPSKPRYDPHVYQSWKPTAATMGRCDSWRNGSRVSECNRVSFRHVRYSLERLALSKQLADKVTSSVKTRIQVQVKRKATDSSPLTTNDTQYVSTLDAIVKIIEDEGVMGLYSGINGSLIGVASTNFAYFYWYSVVRTLYIKSQKIPQNPSTTMELSLGAAAGAIAQVFTIPVAVITTRQQTQPKNDKKGLLDTGREVVNSDDGWSGLWRGLKASLVLVVNPAITYGAYQRLRLLMFPGKINLRPWESFCEF